MTAGRRRRDHPRRWPFQPIRPRQAGRATPWPVAARARHRRRTGPTPKSGSWWRHRAPGPVLPADVRLVHDPSAYEGPLAFSRRSPRPAGRASWWWGATCRGSSAPSWTRCWRRSRVRRRRRRAGTGRRPRPLPMALRREPRPRPPAVSAMVNAGCGPSPRRSRPRSWRRPTWRALDPYGMTVRDVDTPADLR